SPSSDSDAQFCVQHLLRKLGAEPYIGHRTMLAVSQRILALADSLLFMDPFDNVFPNAHSCMFLLIQLVEFLISDYIQFWTSDREIDMPLFEEWLTSVVQARKALSLLESRNGLYLLYMDRVTGELAKQVGQVSCIQTLNREILESLFH
ncbi:Multipolar spindle, partial [Thalictrum thalictroides]